MVLLPVVIPSRLRYRILHNQLDLALSAALLLGIQFWYADRGGIYVLWYLPFLLLLVFRPNLSDRVPPVINPETDWLVRLGHVLKRWALRLLKLPSSPVHVS